MNELWGVGLAIAFAYGLALLPVALLALAVPYTIIRLRGETRPDSQLGAKVAFQFFFSSSIMIGLTGLTILAVDWMLREGSAPPPTEIGFERLTLESWTAAGFNTAQRIGFAFILSGLAGAAIHALLLHATTVIHRHRIRRTFIGWRFAIHGVIAMFALTALLVILLQPKPFEQPTVSAVRAVTAVLLVWGGSWVVHLILLFELSLRIPTETPVVADDGVKTSRAVAAPPIIGEPAELTTLTIFSDRDADAIPDIGDGELPAMADENVATKPPTDR